MRQFVLDISRAGWVGGGGGGGGGSENILALAHQEILDTIQ